MKSVKDFNVQGKSILVRCDFNVPLDFGGGILDDTKIRETLPTLQYLLSHGAAKVIIITHLGDGHESLDSITARLGELLPSERIMMLENVRSHKEETENNEAFAEQLALLGDIYINEAFDVCHRAHASVVGIPKFLPHGAGFLLEKEVNVLSQIMHHPKRPLVAIIGGKKVETKAAYVEGISKIADTVLINGLIKKELVKQHSSIFENVRIFGPAGNLDAFDIDEKTIKLFREIIMQAKTVFWNGPFGKFEEDQYKKGTLAIANAIIESKAFSVVGGGETLQFLRQEGILDQFSHVSTAGGAMLEFLSGQPLSGLIALDN